MPTHEVWTLRQFLESDQVIDCDCSNYWVCAHTGPLRIDLAIQRLGWDFDFYDRREELSAHVFCSVCGRHRPTFRLGWKTRPHTYAGTHGVGGAVCTLLVSPSDPTTWNEPSDWMTGGSHIRKFGPRR